MCLTPWPDGKLLQAGATVVQHCILSIWHRPGTEEVSASVRMTPAFTYVIASERHHLPEED